MCTQSAPYTFCLLLNCFEYTDYWTCPELAISPWTFDPFMCGDHDSLGPSESKNQTASWWFQPLGDFSHFGRARNYFCERQTDREASRYTDRQTMICYSICNNRPHLHRPSTAMWPKTGLSIQLGCSTETTKIETKLHQRNLEMNRTTYSDASVSSLMQSKAIWNQNWVLWKVWACSQLK